MSKPKPTAAPEPPPPPSFAALQSLAAARGAPLVRAYVKAGIPTSTYYRHLRERNGMRLGTYVKVLSALVGSGS